MTDAEAGQFKARLDAFPQGPGRRVDMSEQMSGQHPDYLDPAAEDAEEMLTMNQRIPAFSRQSGGPGVPRIGRFLDHHPRRGTDHGAPGHQESLKDVFSCPCPQRR